MSLQSSFQPELQSSEGFAGTGKATSKMAHSHGCWQEASVPSFLLWRSLEGLHDKAASFPQSKGSDSKVEAAMSFMTQEVTPHHFHNILLVT